jgi:hypothetical protein
MKARFLLCALALLAACGQPEEKQKGSPAAAPGVAQSDEPGAPRLDHQTVIGTWSFDGSCASGDGMGVDADGSAFYDEWGTGNWRITPQNQLVFDLVRREMGATTGGEPVTLTINVTGASEEALELEIAGADAEPRVVTAMRCS